MPSAAIEYRDPSAATDPVRFVGVGQPQIPAWSADRAIDDGLYASSILYRAIRVKAEAVAGLPFRAGTEPPERLGGVAEHNRQSPLARLLGPAPGGPAPKLPARRLIAWSLVQLFTTGRFAWEIETTGTGGSGEVVALWPLLSAKLQPVPSQGGNSWWTGFRYGPNGAEPKRLRPDQVFYFWNPSARDFREPESALEAGAYDIDVSVLTDRYERAFRKNDAKPAQVVTTHQFADRDQYEAFKRQWNSTYGGVDDAGRTMFTEVEDDGTGGVEGSVSIQAVGLSQKDAQLLETYKVKQAGISMVLGVPRSMLGDASERTFSNADAEERVFWRVTMPYPIGDLEDAINMELAPRFGSEVGWFDASGVEALQTPPKPVTAPASAVELANARLMTIDEARADFGLPALDGSAGDRLMTVDEITALNPGPTGLALPAGRSATVLPLHRESRVAVDRADRRERLWKSNDAQLRTYESQWVRGLRRLFGRQQDSSVKRLRGNSRGAKLVRSTPEEVRQRTEDVFEPDFWRSRTEDEVRALYESVASGAFARLSDQFGISFDLEAEFAQAFINDRASQLAGYVTDTTYGAIQDQLAEGVGAGEGIDDLAARVESVFEQASSSRAVTIAQTEVISASNGAALEAVGTLGPDVVAAAEWVAARDSRTRDSHSGADGQVVPIGTPFTVGGAQLAYPGDPAGPADQTVRCRCSIAFLTPEEFTP